MGTLARPRICIMQSNSAYNLRRKVLRFEAYRQAVTGRGLQETVQAFIRAQPPS